MIGRYPGRDNFGYIGSIKNTLERAGNGSLYTNDNFVITDSTGSAVLYGNTSNINNVTIGRTIKFADLEEDASHGFVIDSGNVVRGAGSTLVMTADDTTPVSQISFPIFPSRFLYAAVAVKMTLEFTSGYTAGAFPDLDSRFGIKGTVDNATTQYFEATASCSSGTQNVAAIMNTDGAGTFVRNASSAMTTSQLEGVVLTIRPDLAGSINYPAMQCEILRDWNDGVVRAFPGATRPYSAGGWGTQSGFDFATYPTQGWDFVLYVDQGATGSTVVATLEYISVNLYPSTVAP